MPKIVSLLFLILVLGYSCKKETGVQGPTGPIGNAGTDGSSLDTGTLSGNLAVYNEFSWPLLDSSGVAVSLSVGGSQKSVMSDASGNYYFHGLPSGTYDLTYQKSGFGIMKVFGISHSPGSSISTIVPEVYVLQNPAKTAVDSIHLVDGSSYVEVYIYLDTSSLTYVQYQLNFALLIGKNSDIGTSNTTVSPLSEFITPDGNGAYTLIHR